MAPNGETPADDDVEDDMVPEPEPLCKRAYWRLDNGCVLPLTIIMDDLTPPLKSELSSVLRQKLGAMSSADVSDVGSVRRSSIQTENLSITVDCVPGDVAHKLLWRGETFPVVRARLVCRAARVATSLEKVLGADGAASRR